LGFDADARIGGTVCQSTNWVNNRQLTCMIAPGINIAAPVVATVSVEELGAVYIIPLDAEVQFSYDKAKIFDVAPYNGAGIGSDTIMLGGKNFGVYDKTPSGRVGFTAAMSTNWVSDSFMTVLNADSPVAEMATVVTLAFAVETRPSSFSYDQHSLVRLSPTNSRTGGGVSMTIEGQNFGKTDHSPHVQMGSTTCMATAWLSDSFVLCKLPANTESGVPVIVTNMGVVKIFSGAFSYNDPFVTSFVPSNIALSGGERVLITGYNFGGSEYDPRAARFGDTSCVETIWTSDTSVSCVAQRGYASDLEVAFTVAQVINKADGFQYNKPQIQDLVSSNGPASGSAEIFINGNSFGVYELTPQAWVGDTACMKTAWVADSTVLCKVPSVTYDKWFHGATKNVQLVLGAEVNVWEDSFTYDMACVGPCVIGLGCSSSSGARGCNGKTGGDYRHTEMSKAVRYDNFEGENILRILGNFTLTGGDVTTGNTTNNITRFVTEQIFNGDVSIIFGDLFTCEPIIPDRNAWSTVESYLDCYMPAGVGYGHEIKVTIRNATYKALLDGCDIEMKKWGENIWPPPPAPGGQKFGNCFLPDSLADEFKPADSIGLTFTYNAPKVTSIEPSTGPNMRGQTANITIFGTDFGGKARDVWGSRCLRPPLNTLPACKQLFENGIGLANDTCKEMDLQVSGKRGDTILADVLEKKLAYCRSQHTYMIQCLHAFFDSSLNICTERCDFPWFGCGRNCPEDQLRCQTPLLGGKQKVGMVIGGLTSEADSTFVYEPPEVEVVFPPELPAGSSSLLTVTGRNFGGYLAMEYGGRVFDGDDLLREYDSAIIPFNTSSVRWWDWAQYQTCFSGATESDTESDEVVNLRGEDRKCDQGVVYSSKIEIMSTVSGGVPLDRMVVQSPSLIFDQGTVVKFVDVIAQSIAQRSPVDPIGARVSFRAPCSNVNPKLGDLIIPFYMGNPNPVWTSRSSFTAISNVDNKIWIMGGATQTQAEKDEVFVSGFNGVGGWQRNFLDLLWWSSRVNASAVVFQDTMFLAGGFSPVNRTCYNDVWVYAHSPETQAYYSLPDTPTPSLARDDTFQPFWIRVMRNAPWPPRRRAVLLVFLNKVWLMGGQRCNGDWTYDLWSSTDMRDWKIEDRNAAWRGRNEIFGTVHENRMYVVGSVQNQFYNTFYTEDGKQWQQLPNSCAVTKVTVQALITFRRYLILFTLGCHDTKDGNEPPVDCDHETAGRLENRMYYSRNGRFWTLSRKPYEVDQYQRAVHVQHSWSGARDGEYRWDYKVVVHLDTIFLIGGERRYAATDLQGNFFFDEDGEISFTVGKSRDIYVSKGPTPISKYCNDKKEGGLEYTDFQEKIEYTMATRQCVWYWTEQTISDATIEELDAQLADLMEL